MTKPKRMLMLTLLFLILTLTNIKSAFAFAWSIQERRLTTDLSFDGAPAITQTDDRKIWIVWEKEAGGTHNIFYVTSSDLGSTWSQEENITKLQSTVQNVDPSITQTTDGTIWVVWASTRLPPPPPPEPDFNMSASPPSLSILKGSSDTSTITVTSINNFSDPVSLYTALTPFNVTATLDPTQVTPPPNATASSTLTIAVGTEASPGNYTITVIGKSANKSHSVSVALEITNSITSSFTEPLLSALSEPPYPDAQSNYNIYYRTSNDNGASWLETLPLTQDASSNIAPCIMQAQNGTIWVVWSSTRTGNYDIFYKTSSDFGSTWSDGIQLTFDSQQDKRPKIFQTRDEKIWVVWYSNRYGNNTILYKTYDGSSWSTERLTYNAFDSNTSPTIVQTVNGTILIFWVLSGLGSNDTGDIYYKQSFDNGATWSGSIQFTTDANEDMWPVAERTSDTRIWVLWTSNRADQPDGNFDVWYRTSLVGDVNNDGIVDIFDLSEVSWAFGTQPGDPNWNPDADINKDNKIDLDDLMLVGRNYGST